MTIKRNGRKASLTSEDESQPPPTQLDEPEHSNGGRTIYWGCVNRTYHVTGDRESVATGRRDDQAGTNYTGLKIYVACVIENYHRPVTSEAGARGHTESKQTDQVQQELDAVVGEGLPTLSHRSQLSYVNACLLEVMRIRTVVPFALPHATTETDKVREYDIPKGISCSVVEVYRPTSTTAFRQGRKHGAETGLPGGELQGFSLTSLVKVWLV
ncbi:hypothetical protein Bbelb_048050 [Branchiostoma belcheri]|nr:hypothetical protein Bbelb_048050 [Branchiostoma belcheri]